MSRRLRRLCRSSALCAAVTVILVTLSACKSAAGPNTAPDDRITQLNVITVPVALDLDGKAGPDGIAVKLYAASAKSPKAIRLREGKVELVMFNGTFQNRTNQPAILRTFSYEAKELRLHELNSGIGWGYEFTLSWGTNLPTQRLISVGARYTAPDGRSIVSRTSSVTVLNK
jgi:hypothetical protein